MCVRVQDLIVCLAFLTGICMIIGLGAELLLGVSQATKTNRETSLTAKEAEAEKQPLDLIFISQRCYMGAWAMHLLGWVCMGVVWSIILIHYNQWFDMDGPSTACLQDYLGNWAGAAPGEPLPTLPPPPQERASGDFAKVPDFVKGIIGSQCALFICFGFVQTFQLMYPDNRARAEFAYILLSLIAKFVLGLMVALNIFV